jgi:predicted nucleic acid-binding protein
VRSFLDSSVLVAALWGDHEHHPSSLDVFAQAEPGAAACGVHSLAEVYATITALPVRPLVAPEQAMLLIEQIPRRLVLVALDAAEYVETIRDASERQLTSGRIYDALLLACARKHRAEVIYTWNVKHFRQIAPDLAEIVHTPAQH